MDEPAKDKARESKKTRQKITMSVTETHKFRNENFLEESAKIHEKSVETSGYFKQLNCYDH